jgi:DNA-binding transcriptional ArsR family regulator
MIFDVLSQSNGKKTFNDIKKGVDEIDAKFQEGNVFDDSTIQKKLKEYANEGVVTIEKQGRNTVYSLTEDNITLNAEAIKYFSETAPCGVIGSFLLDKMNESQDFFSYKHHYINSALDSEVLYNIFDAISKKSYMVATNFDRALGEEIKIKVVPLKVFSGAQDGRQHLIAYNEDVGTFRTYRLDYLSRVETDGVCKNFQKYRTLLTECEKYMWSVNVSSSTENLAKIEFTVFVDDNEAYIVNRLEREKRGGTVTRIDKNHYKFSFETYKANDLIPWIRTFICRITDLYISDDEAYGRIKNDLNEMYELYNIGGDKN